MVEDSGPGIAEADLQRIFDRFYQVDGSATRSAAGTGIGLALSQEIVKLHRGRLEVWSEVGVGSRFTFTLPRGRDHLKEDEIATDHGETAAGAFEVPAALRAIEAKHPPSPASVSEAEDRTTVLLVEDNPELRAFLRGHLTDRYRILEAADGRAGLEMAREEMPDVIITDVMMPELDGIGLCRALRQDPATDFLPVLMLTGRADQEDRLEGLGVGADGYLVKPFDARELRLVVAQILASRRRLLERWQGQVAPPELHLRQIDATSADELFLDRVREAVENLLDAGEASVDALAAALAMDRSHLYRRLTEVLDETPSELLRRCRLERAGQLLQQRAGTVSEIAYAVGYRSLSHFGQAFRAEYGVSPSAYSTRSSGGVPAPS